MSEYTELGSEIDNLIEAGSNLEKYIHLIAYWVPGLREYYIPCLHDSLCTLVSIKNTIASLKISDLKNNALYLSAKGTELIFWERKLLEHVMRLIRISTFDRSQLLIENKREALSFVNKQLKERKRLTRMEIKCAKSKTIKEFCDGDLKSLPNGKQKLDLSISKLYFDAISVAKWSEKYFLWQNYELAYGSPSYQIHANTLLHLKGPGGFKQEKLHYILHIIKLILIRTGERIGEKIEYKNINDEGSKADYLQYWGHSFESGQTVRLKTAQGREICSIIRIIKGEYDTLWFEIKLQGSTESQIVQWIYLEELDPNPQKIPPFEEN